MKFKTIAMGILVGAVGIAATGCTSNNSQTTGACRTGNVKTKVVSCTIKTRAACDLLKSTPSFVNGGNYVISFTPNAACI